MKTAVTEERRTKCPPLAHVTLKGPCSKEQPIVYLRSPCYHSNWTSLLAQRKIDNETLHFSHGGLAFYVEPDGQVGVNFPHRYLRRVIYAMKKCDVLSSFTPIIVAPACPTPFSYWYDHYIDFLSGVITRKHGYLVLNPTVSGSSEALADLPSTELLSTFTTSSVDTASLRIINLNGDTSMHAEVLYELLSKFQWESLCLLELRKFTGRRRGQRVAGRSGCSDIFAMVEQQSFLNNRDINHLYWYFEDEITNETIAKMESIWRYVKPLTRIVILCGYPLRLSRTLLRIMSKTLISDRNYAVIYFDMFLHNRAVLDSLSDAVPYIHALRGIKVLTMAEDTACRDVKWELFTEFNLTSATGSPVSDYLQDGLHCALHHLTRAALEADNEADQYMESETVYLMQEFFKRYNKPGRLFRQNVQRRAVDYLKDWTLLSFDAKAMAFVPVVNLSWTISDVGGSRRVRVTINDSGEAIWASGASNQLDGTSNCWGYPNFFPCEAEVDYSSAIALVFVLIALVCLLLLVTVTIILLRKSQEKRDTRKLMEESCFVLENDLKPSSGFGTLVTNEKFFLAALRGEDVIVRCVGVIGDITKLQPEVRLKDRVYNFCAPYLHSLRLTWLRRRLSKILYRIILTLLRTHDISIGVDIEREASEDEVSCRGPTRNRSYLRFSNSFLEEISMLKLWTTSEENIATFKGVMYLQIDRPRLYFIYEYCPMGSLASFLGHIPTLSSEMRYLLAYDVICGLQSLHCRHQLVHGHLRASCVQIDNNCRAKILVTRLDSMEGSVLQRPQGFSQLYLAPEILRGEALRPTREADMYSYGIVLHQIVYQKCAFYIEKDKEEMERKYVRVIHPNLITTDNIEKIHKYCQSKLPGDSRFSMYPREDEARFIVDKIVGGSTIRPSIMPTEDDMRELVEVMQYCWQEDPNRRMDCSCALMRITLAMRLRSNDTFYNIAKRVSAGAGDLESILADRSERIRKQRDHCLRLLSGIMPLSIASSMMSGSKTRISKVELASIYFHGVYNFKKAYTTADEAVRFLDKLYGTCDRIASMYDVTPLHRVNDTLLIASGVLNPCAEHASELAMVAVQLHEAIRTQFPGMQVEIKSGINSGTVVCGVVGTKVPMYAVFGDTVNVASRMYSTSEPGRTQISENTYRLLRKKRRIFNMVKRGPIEVKGKGTMNTYWLRTYRKYLGCVPTDARLDCVPTSAELDFTLGNEVSEIDMRGNDKSTGKSEESSCVSSGTASVSQFTVHEERRRPSSAFGRRAASLLATRRAPRKRTSSELPRHIVNIRFSFRRPRSLSR